MKPWRELIKKMTDIKLNSKALNISNCKFSSFREI